MKQYVEYLQDKIKPLVNESLLQYRERVQLDLALARLRTVATIFGHEISGRRLLSFLNYYYQVSECVLYNGCKTHNGYAQINIGGRSGTNVRAHRIIYAMWNGSVFDHLQVMHSCDNRSCGNPLHLAEGTPRENTADMVLKGRHKYITHPKVDETLLQKMLELKATGASNVTVGRILGLSHETVRVYTKGE